MRNIDQVQAMVNKGNAGGLVIDADGNVLGMANQMTQRAMWRRK